MYLEDAPIKTQDEDLLHRRNFAKRLGKSIFDTNTKDGYCIGLFGPWGSGKSSVVNMVLEEIGDLAIGKKAKPIVMYFNPWNFSSSEQLIRQYFLMLANKFSSQADKRLNSIGSEIQKYAGMLETLGDIGKVLGVGGQLAARFLKNKSITGTKDISKQRDLIVKKLQEQKQKVIIVIDDIDRLSNDEIKLIFQLVNSVAKFPNTIYLLSFDKEIVARALSDVQNYDGEKYLEKIIQVPIEIPEVSNDYLWEALFSRLKEVLESHTGIIWEEDYWGKIFSECISKYIHNIRDVVRLINALNIKFDIIGGEVNFADMVAITIIEIKLPKLYRWIKENRNRLVGGVSEYLRFFGKQPSEIEEYNKQEMRILSNNHADEYYDLLKMIFPYYAKGSGDSYYNNDLLRRYQRIGHEDIFSRYFVLEVDNEGISRKEFDYAITKLNDTELCEYLERVNSNKAIISFLKELSAANQDIKVERVPILVKVLFNNAILFKGTDSRVIFSVSAFNMVEYRIQDLFLKLDNEDSRFVLLKEVISSGNNYSIQMLVTFINTIELSHGRLAANGVENGEKKLITVNQLEICEQLLVKRIMEISNECCLLDMENARMVLYLYESLDKDSYITYMKFILKDDLYKLKFLGFFAEKWTSGSKITWKYKEGYLELLTEDEIERAFKECLQNKSIWSLELEKQQRVIAFLLWKREISTWNDDVDDKKVMEKIDELKNKALESINDIIL